MYVYIYIGPVEVAEGHMSSSFVFCVSKGPISIGLSRFP